MVNLETHHRADDASPVHITREIPLVWLVGVAFGLIVQAVTLYLGQQAQSEAIRALSTEVKELRAEVRSGTLKDVEYGLRLDDHERRVTTIENRQAAQQRAAEQAAQAAGRK